MDGWIGYGLMIRVESFNSEKELEAAAAALLIRHLARPGNLMLSGGSTPNAIYRHLAAHPVPVHPERRLFLSDERMVPVDLPQSNFGNLRPMLRAFECESRFLAVDTARPAEEAAEQFSRDLEPLNAIDLGFLGMGTDGHTAGIFDMDMARSRGGAFARHTQRPDGMEGITVTPTIFARVERIILLVTGEAKRDIVHRLMDNPKALPVGAALSDHPCVELWTNVAP